MLGLGPPPERGQAPAQVQPPAPEREQPPAPERVQPPAPERERTEAPACAAGPVLGLRRWSVQTCEVLPVRPGGPLGSGFPLPRLG